MRAWKLCVIAERCGACGAVVPKGGAICFVQLPKLTRPLKRCADCADIPLPDDLEALAPTTDKPALRPWKEVVAERLAALRNSEREEREWYR